MTLVAGFDWSDGMVMVADTRLTRERADGKRCSSLDCLQKLYPVGPAAVLGFSGDYHAAKSVFNRLRSHSPISRNHINLANEILLGITEAIQINPSRQGVRFMLCGISPSAAAKGTMMLRNPGARLFVYRVHQGSNTVTLDEDKSTDYNNYGVSVIGSGSKLEKTVRDIVYDYRGLALSYPEHHRFFANVVREIIAAEMASEHQALSDTVGGPYLLFSIMRDTEPVWKLCWPPGAPDGNVRMQRICRPGSETIELDNPDSPDNRKYYIHPIWDTDF